MPRGREGGGGGGERTHTHTHTKHFPQIFSFLSGAFRNKTAPTKGSPQSNIFPAPDERGGGGECLECNKSFIEATIITRTKEGGGEKKEEEGEERKGGREIFFVGHTVWDRLCCVLYEQISVGIGNRRGEGRGV